jgi:hypothetical protein
MTRSKRWNTARLYPNYPNPLPPETPAERLGFPYVYAESTRKKKYRLRRINTEEINPIPLGDNLGM